MSKRLSHTEEYRIIDLGRKAYKEGIARDECPYLVDDPRRGAWLAGWDHGEARFRKTQWKAA